LRKGQDEQKCFFVLSKFELYFNIFISSKNQLKSNLVEISLQQELFEDVDEFWQGRKAFLEVLDQFHRPKAVGHVEADVDLDVGQPIGHLDDRHLKS